MSDSLPFSPAALRGARTPDGTRVDVELDGGRVTRVLPAGSMASLPDAQCLDLSGYLLTTAAAEPHAHLDKAQSFDTIRPPMGDLGAAIIAWHQHCEVMTVADIAARARATVRRMLASGITAIRSHVDVLPGPLPTRGAQALAQVRDEFRGIVDIQLVALAGWRSSDADIEAVLDLGMDLLGGASHLTPDPAHDLARLLAIADRRDLPIDLHTDENLTGPSTLDLVAAAVRKWERSVTASHCVRLGTLGPADLGELIEGLLAADIGVVTLPITNLYLQGWEHPVDTPRGLPPLRKLLDAGVRVAAGADNVRDPFNPVGRCDPMETAALLITAGHLDLATALHLVTDGARDVLGLAPAGPTAGRQADLLAIRAESLGDAIGFASADRVVLTAGRVISRTTVTTDQMSSSPAPPASASGVRRPNPVGASL